MRQDKDTVSTLEMRAIVEDGNGNMVEKPTKTKAGRRMIPIMVDGTVYKILQNLAVGCSSLVLPAVSCSYPS